MKTVTQKSKPAAIRPADEEKILQSYRAARKRTRNKPLMITIVLIPGGLVQIWEGQPQGTIPKR